MAAQPQHSASVPPSHRPAENELAWPSLAPLLAPAAGCDCQMLAVALAASLHDRPAPKVAER